MVDKKHTLHASTMAGAAKGKNPVKGATGNVHKGKAAKTPPPSKTRP